MHPFNSYAFYLVLKRGEQVNRGLRYDRIFDGLNRSEKKPSICGRYCEKDALIALGLRSLGVGVAYDL